MFSHLMADDSLLLLGIMFMLMIIMLNYWPKTILMLKGVNKNIFLF